MNAAQIKAVVATMVQEIVWTDMRRGSMHVRVNGEVRCINVKDCGFSVDFLRSIVAQQIA